MITSTKNPTIQHIRKLQARARARREAGQFVLEGRRLVADALAAGQIPNEVLFTVGMEADFAELLALCRSARPAAGQKLDPIPVSEAVMQAASDTRTPQGILAVFPAPDPALPEALSFALVLDAIRDPGNLGTILRTAAAAGVEAVLLGPECVDPFSPKVLRAGMGAHFRIPLRSLSWKAIAAHTAGLELYLADSGAGLAYTRADFRKPCALIVGGEAHGPGNESRRLRATAVHIPMPGKMESLNAAMAAGVIIYEVLRQRQGN